ncbi:zinc-dependent alcohol dehydrogenase family protein [Novosphingobium sp.]|uniref:zinc-dependent alcohol dehydrogenase family protein n=1 Tax=Novosphingobium sp. TaxID=1874826 RepID=UPI0038BD40F9
MKAVRLVAPGSLEGLKLVDESERPLGDRDVRIRVHAASLNFRDLVIVAGQYPGFLKDCPIPLSDGAGEVIAVGAHVTRVKIGDRVAASCYPHWIGGPFLQEYHAGATGMTIDGMLAETATLDENAFVHLPEYLTYAEAAALPCAAVSAWSALNVQEPLQAGQTVLIQGTGGVALFGLQLAQIHGARVLAITSSKSKVDLLLGMGADAVVNYAENEDWHEAILDLTRGQGVDKVVEIGGEKTIGRAVACTRYGGELGLVGFVSGFGGGLPPLDIMKRSVLLKGISIGSRLALQRVIDALASRNVRPVISKEFGFSEFVDAYRYMQDGKHIGKVVINVSA